MTLHSLHAAPPHRPSSTPKGIATAHFGQLRDPLLAFIGGSEVVVGCVAWVTDKHILDALATRQVALVVQKERWWKQGDARGQALARRYAALSGSLPASAFPDPLATKPFRGKPVPNDAVLPPIACVGHASGGQFQPLMHHKFIVRCRIEDGLLVPLAVWTGSFNFSSNANDSFENAVEIHDPTIAAAYLAEFALVASVSEAMNWRFAKPSPKGVPVAFAPLPPKPKASTTRVVKKAGARKQAAKKTAAARVAQPAKRTARKATAARKAVPATRRKAA